MKVKLVMGTVIMATSMLLTGCGNDTPEGVAEEFAMELTVGNLKNADSFSTKKVRERLKQLDVECHDNLIQNLADESSLVLDTFNERLRDKKYEVQAKEFSENFIKDMQITMTKYRPEMIKMKKEIEEKYGSIDNVPDEVKEEYLSEKMMPLLEELLFPALDKGFKIFELKTENKDKVKTVFLNSIFLMMKDGGGPKIPNIYDMRKGAKLVISKVNEPVSQECVAKYTKFGHIDDIDIIEVIEKSPDKFTVRLEIIDTKGQSNKVPVEVEKIKDEWKVSELYFTRR